MQKLLEIHCLHLKKKTLVLKHGYYHAVNMGSDYVGIFPLRHGVEASFFVNGGLVSPTLRIRGLSYTLNFSHFYC